MNVQDLVNVIGLTGARQRYPRIHWCVQHEKGKDVLQATTTAYGKDFQLHSSLGPFGVNLAFVDSMAKGLGSMVSREIASPSS